MIHDSGISPNVFCPLAVCWQNQYCQTTVVHQTPPSFFSYGHLRINQIQDYLLILKSESIPGNRDEGLHVLSLQKSKSRKYADWIWCNSLISIICSILSSYELNEIMNFKKWQRIWQEKVLSTYDDWLIIAWLSISAMSSSRPRDWILCDDLSRVSILRKELNRELDPAVPLLRTWDEPSDVPSVKYEAELVRSSGGGGRAEAHEGGSWGIGRSCGLASVRQMGHVVCKPNHLSMHSAWKMWLQLGNSRTMSSSSRELRQTAHSGVAGSSPSPSPAPAAAAPLNLKTGREAITAESRPALWGCGSAEWRRATLRLRLCWVARRRAWRPRMHLA